VLAVFGTAASQALDPALAHAATPATAARSNHDSSKPRLQRSRDANRRAGRHLQQARPAPTRPVATLAVDNCNDAGPGSLRDTLATAIDGDTIDLSGLTCSTITLTSGVLYADGSLEIRGPGRDLLTIDGNASDLVLVHYGESLRLADLTLANGASSDGIGGCLWGAGNLEFTNARATGCVAGDGSNNSAWGAGLDALGNVILVNSIVTGNSAKAAGSAQGGGVYAGRMAYVLGGSIISDNLATVSGHYGESRGGGLFAGQSVVVAEASRITGNRVEALDESANYSTAYGGGIHVGGGAAVVVAATVSGNTAHSELGWSYGGGINAGEYGGVGGGVVVVQSTVSGNVVSANCDSCLIQGGGMNTFDQAVAKYSTIRDNQVLSAVDSDGISRGGGLFAMTSYGASGEIQVLQSTISGNTTRGGEAGYGEGMGGAIGTIGAELLVLNSTIAFNTASHVGGGLAPDIGSYGGATTLVSSIVAQNQAPRNAEIGLPDWAPPPAVAGSNNLLLAAPDAEVILPADTLFADPLLQPLAGNGGPTATHAIPACSPAIDAGLNPEDAEFDQRLDPYVRVFAGGVDIGAFELQPDPDAIFTFGFDPSPCP
jgi:hypothetical protein